MAIPCLLRSDWLSVFYQAVRRNIHGEKLLKHRRFSIAPAAAIIRIASQELLVDVRPLRGPYA
jgi:hypothetical protein